MSGVYGGLVQGRCGRYYMEIILDIYKESGKNEFKWGKIMEKYPHITKSVLSRMKCSGYILKQRTGKYCKEISWKLHPVAIEMLYKRKYI